jgi:hopanoid biosynthesis associated protein HpnK
VRRLIINADDFGLTSGVNRAIVEAHQHGVVTSATLMANGAALPDAVHLSQSVPRLGVGCHVVLVDGTPVSDASQVRSLLGDHGDAHFGSSLVSFALRCKRRKLVAGEIEIEATAQIRKLQSAGVVISHLDTHKHTHMFPEVFLPVIRAAQACGVRAIRNPQGPAFIGQIARRPALWKRWAQVRILSFVAVGFRRAVMDAGMVTTDGTLGIVATGAMDEQILVETIAHIPDGTWELVCHPGYDDEDLAKAGTRLRASRVQELEILKSPVIRQELEKHEIELISYRDLS